MPLVSSKLRLVATAMLLTATVQAAATETAKSNSSHVSTDAVI
jgi:hypothetical protein